MSDPVIRVYDLDHMTKVAYDIKKSFAYNKHTGLWSWYDRGEEFNSGAWHGGFDTWLDALEDAVEPYMDDNE